MKKLIAAAIMLTTAHTAHAGPYTDDLSKCLVESSTAQDKLDLVKWMFAAMALHPAVEDLASVEQSDRDTQNEVMANLIFRLIAEDCVETTRKVVKYEGPEAIQASFQILGQVAAGELFTNPKVAEGLSELDKYIDADKFNDILGGNE